MEKLSICCVYVATQNVVFILIIVYYILTISCYCSQSDGKQTIFFIVVKAPKILSKLKTTIID